jgi:hypothetical protein
LVSNVLAHVLSEEMIQVIIGSSCLMFESSLRSADPSNLSTYLIVMWSHHPKLIPTEVGCSILELVEPFVEAEPPLFIRSSEVIHLKCDLLHFHVFIRILKVHDFNPPATPMKIVGPSVRTLVRSTRAMTWVQFFFGLGLGSKGSSPA